jgi:hypothetical protein
MLPPHYHQSKLNKNINDNMLGKQKQEGETRRNAAG